ncbi:hypothetical protein [Cryobacterium sp. PH31-O1]|nr:hypothetical protein [Cryobacterium sp. PH31-O1]MDJ0338253.1 hypothetical protein [Cryobacterium sp. PH31-O1]
MARLNAAWRRFAVTFAAAWRTSWPAFAAAWGFVVLAAALVVPDL